MHAFVVNLRRRPDRRQRLEHLLPPSWEVEWTTNWPGPVDGASIDPAHLDGFGLFPWQIRSSNEWWNRPLKLGEIGCAVNHLSIWKRAATEHLGLTVVLEDDVELCPDIETRLPEQVERLTALDPEWDFVYLGRWALDPAHDAPVCDGIVRPAYSYCTYGYAVSAKGLADLLSVDYDHALIPVDELLPALQLPHPRPDVRRRYPPFLHAYAFDPPLVTQLPKEIAGSDTEATAFAT